MKWNGLIKALIIIGLTFSIAHAAQAEEESAELNSDAVRY